MYYSMIRHFPFNPYLGVGYGMTLGIIMAQVSWAIELARKSV